MAELNTFDNRSVLALRDDHRKLQRQVRDLASALERRSGDGTPDVRIHFGATVARPGESYPAAPANTFWVVFHDWTFVESPGEQPITKRPWQAGYVLARTVDGEYLEEGTEVVVEKLPGPKGRRWWIRRRGTDASDGSPELEFVELTTSLSLGGFGRARLLVFSLLTGAMEMIGPEFRVQDYTRGPGVEPGDLSGAVGYRGWARRPRNESIEDEEGNAVPTWPLVRLEQVAEIIRGTLTGPMIETTTPGYYGPVGTGLFTAPAMVTDWYDGKSPGTTQTVYDPAGLFKRALTGAKFTARRNNRAGADDTNGGTSGNPRGRYEVIECQSKAGHISGRLMLPRFAYGPTYPQGTYVPAVDGIYEVQVADGDWWGAQQDVQDPRDANGRVRVFFEGWEYPFAPAGAWGVYSYDAERDLYYPDEVDQMALAIRFTLLNNLCGAITPAQPGAIGASFSSMSPYPFSVFPDNAVQVPIANSMVHQGETGDLIFAKFDASAKQYEIIDAPGKDVDLFTDLRLFRDSPGACAKIQVKKVSARVESCQASTPTWEDSSIRMENLDVVTEVELVSTPYIPEDLELETPAVPATCVVKRTQASVCILSNEITTTNEAGEITGYTPGYTPTVGVVFAFQSTPVMVDAGEVTDELYGTLAYVWTGPCDPEFIDADFTIAEIGECTEEEEPPP